LVLVLHLLGRFVTQYASLTLFMLIPIELKILHLQAAAVMHRGAWKLGLQHIDLLPLSKASMTTPIPLDVRCGLYISFPYLIACGQIDF
jgi:hypothetical protein